LAPDLFFSYRLWARRIPPSWWFINSRKRAAMCLALRSVAQLGHEIDWSGCFIKGADHEKCFCFLQYRHNGVIIGPAGYRVYAVWFATGRVDDLGDWVFHWGVVPWHAIKSYEECRAVGRPWPAGLAEWARDWE